MYNASYHGGKATERQACIMQGISELNLSLEVNDTATLRFNQVLSHLYDYEQLLRELNGIEIISQ